MSYLVTNCYDLMTCDIPFMEKTIVFFSRLHSIVLNMLTSGQLLCGKGRNKGLEVRNVDLPPVLLSSMAVFLGLLLFPRVNRDNC